MLNVYALKLGFIINRLYSCITDNCMPTMCSTSFSSRNSFYLSWCGICTNKLLMLLYCHLCVFASITSLLITCEIRGLLMDIKAYFCQYTSHCSPFAVELHVQTCSGRANGSSVKSSCSGTFHSRLSTGEPIETVIDSCCCSDSSPPSFPLAPTLLHIVGLTPYWGNIDWKILLG